MGSERSDSYPLRLYVHHAFPTIALLTVAEVGAFIIERAGTDMQDVMTRLEPRWRENIHVIHQVQSLQLLLFSLY
jgi:hypothetical protein